MKFSEYNVDAVSGPLANGHGIGPVGAAVHLLEYGDYECPSCSEAEPAVRHLIDAFGSHLRFEFRHFPLVDVHQHAELAAEAAEAAAAQKKFWPMHHLLFTHWQHLERSALTRYAEMIELDMRRFSTELSERTYRSRVQDQRRSGEEVGVRGSPAFFLNGQVLDVSFGLEHLELAVRTALGET